MTDITFHQTEPQHRAPARFLETIAACWRWTHEVLHAYNTQGTDALTAQLLTTVPVRDRH